MSLWTIRVEPLKQVSAWTARPGVGPARSVPGQAKGLAWARMLDGKVTSSYQKFLTDEENAAILERAGAKDGDLVLIVGDAKEEVVFAALGALRVECAKQLGLLDPKEIGRAHV